MEIKPNNRPYFQNEPNFEPKSTDSRWKGAGIHGITHLSMRLEMMYVKGFLCLKPRPSKKSPSKTAESKNYRRKEQTFVCIWPLQATHYHQYLSSRSNGVCGFSVYSFSSKIAREWELNRVQEQKKAQALMIEWTYDFCSIFSIFLFIQFNSIQSIFLYLSFGWHILSKIEMNSAIFTEFFETKQKKTKQKVDILLSIKSHINSKVMEVPRHKTKTVAFNSQRDVVVTDERRLVKSKL